MRAIKHPELVHLRRMSARRGVIVVECTRRKIPDGSRLRFANAAKGATCPKCVARAAKEQMLAETVIDEKLW